MVEVQVQAIVCLETKNDTPIRIGDLRIRRKVISFPRRRWVSSQKGMSGGHAMLPTPVCQPSKLFPHVDPWCGGRRHLAEQAASPTLLRKKAKKKRKWQRGPCVRLGCELPERRGGRWRENKRRGHMYCSALYIYFWQGVSCDNETDDKWQVCSHAEIKWADGCKAESRDRQVDTCLASFWAEPEVTGRLETRRQQLERISH